MSHTAGYFTLIGSLPFLPEPGRAERLPINRQRLAQRYRSLGAEETRQLETVADLLLWERAADFTSDAEVVRRYGEVLAEVEHDGLRRFVAYWMELRTVLAALRRRQQGRSAPSREDAWGVDPRALTIERHWEKSDFGLGLAYPWMAEAREHLDAGRAQELEALQARVLWRYLDQATEPDPFAFDAVFAYAIKWHLLSSWLSQDPVTATDRFRNLVEEVSHEQELDVA